MGEGECDSIEPPKKGRHRKKHLYNTILHQMEFYFSDSNLSKDRFLSQLINKEHCKYLINLQLGNVCQDVLTIYKIKQFNFFNTV